MKINLNSTKSLKNIVQDKLIFLCFKFLSSLKTIQVEKCAIDKCLIYVTVKFNQLLNLQNASCFISFWISISFLFQRFSDLSWEFTSVIKLIQKVPLAARTYCFEVSNLASSLLVSSTGVSTYCGEGVCVGGVATTIALCSGSMGMSKCGGVWLCPGDGRGVLG